VPGEGPHTLAGESPVRVKAGSPVAWMAGGDGNVGITGTLVQSELILKPLARPRRNETKYGRKRVGPGNKGLFFEKIHLGTGLMVGYDSRGMGSGAIIIKY